MDIVGRSKYDYITQQDYENVAGPDWPSYDDFCRHDRIPDHVYAEIDSMLQTPVVFDHPAFCVLPFYGMEFLVGTQQTYPSDTICCLIQGKQDREAIKQQMLARIRPKACEVCWKLEDQGLKSDRRLKNETVDFYLKKNIQQLFDECVQEKNSLIHYKIDSNNICNATCATCSSKFSTAWAQLERKNKKTPHKSWKITSEQLNDSINYDTAKSVGFRGGEPFLSSGTWHVLEKLLQHGNQDCFINFTTNGSIQLTQDQKNTISKFKNVNFCFSIDGTHSVFEYLRYPLAWNDVEKNLEYCRNNNILISASWTLSNLNILYFTRTQDWFDQNQIKYHINPVIDPVYFKPSVLTNKIKQDILQKQNNHTVVADFLDLDNSNDEQYFEFFKNKISEQDRWKNIRMRDYMPELASLLG